VISDKIMHSSPISPVTLNPSLPAELERILNKALEKDRDVRYQVAAEIRADLKRLQCETDSGRTPAAMNSSPPTSNDVASAPYRDRKQYAGGRAGGNQISVAYIFSGRKLSVFSSPR